MPNRVKKEKLEERKKVEAQEKSCLDVSDEIDSQMVYLMEIAGLLRYVFEGKTTSIIPLSNVLNDLYDRLEWLKETIEELKRLCKG